MNVQTEFLVILVNKGINLIITNASLSVQEIHILKWKMVHANNVVINVLSVNIFKAVKYAIKIII